jgi:hypothetical protein
MAGTEGPAIEVTGGLKTSVVDDDSGGNGHISHGTANAVDVDATGMAGESSDLLHIVSIWRIFIMYSIQTWQLWRQTCVS